MPPSSALMRDGRSSLMCMPCCRDLAIAARRHRTEAANDDDSVIPDLLARPQRRLLLLAVGLTAAIYGVITNPERTWPNLLIDRILCNVTRSLGHIFSCRATCDRSALVGQPAPSSGSFHAGPACGLLPDYGALLWPSFSLCLEPAGSDGGWTGVCRASTISAACRGSMRA